MSQPSVPGREAVADDLLKPEVPGDLSNKSFAEIQKAIAEVEHRERVKNQKGPRPTPIPVSPRKARRREVAASRRRNR